MAFLDRMVSDLIGKSTGFNARPFVRAVGGKNILLLGGALVAGALAAEKMREPATPSNVPPPPLPLPPVPPLPVPQTSDSDPVTADQALSTDLLFAIVRVMAASALADGEIHADERRVIESRLDESGLSAEQVRRIQKDMVIPPGPGELSDMVETAEDRELVYRFAALVVLADGEISQLERAWLDKLAAAMALGDGRREALEREIFEESSS
ncbi:MAG TPA: DUF533 domain-containing protein [Vicinamibacteria bacterium]|nr:DUF533 domain-containing protein [Vicinamibacteria bacterium]